MKPKAIIFAGYGLNSEEETAYGFDLAGATADIVHINDVVEGQVSLSKYQIMSFPGGFAYGDDTGAGNAYAHKVRNHLFDEVLKFIRSDKLVIGICNGCQIVASLGLVPAFGAEYGARQIALTTNETPRFSVRWCDMKVVNDSPWLAGMTSLSLPIAHGEGRFYADRKALKKIRENKQIALTYYKGPISNFLDQLANPNGSVADIAGITDPTGRILGLMPHPERGMFFTQLPNWGVLKEEYLRAGRKLPRTAAGLQIFRNAVGYFK